MYSVRYVLRSKGEILPEVRLTTYDKSHSSSPIGVYRGKHNCKGSPWCLIVNDKVFNRGIQATLSHPATSPNVVSSIKQKTLWIIISTKIEVEPDNSPVTGSWEATRTGELRQRVGFEPRSNSPFLWVCVGFRISEPWFSFPWDGSHDNPGSRWGLTEVACGLTLGVISLFFVAMVYFFLWAGEGRWLGV